MEKDEIFKVMAKIYEVKDGQVTSLEYPPESGEFFDHRLLEKIKQPEDLGFVEMPRPELEIEKQEPTQGYHVSGTDKGEVIVKTATISIYENVFNDIKQHIEENNMKINNTTVRSIIKNYWPDIKKKSINSYAVIYRKFARKTLNMPIVKFTGIEKGERLGIVRSTLVYANVLHDIENGMLNDEKYMDLMKRVEKYYPGCTKSTYHTYVNHYKRWIKKGSEEQDLPKQERKPYSNRDGIDRGSFITKVGSIRIYEKVLDAYKKVVKETNDIDAILTVFKKFHPKAKRKSHNVYNYAYRKYMGSEKAVFRKKRGKYKRRRPKNCIGLSKTYSTWIKNEEYTLVKKALYKYGFKATSDAIEAETGLRKCRIMPTLDYLIDKKKAYIKLDEYGKRVYRPAI